MHRFFIAPDHWDPDALTLDADESRHCLEVLRCRPGDKVVAFNGAGTEATARIASTGDRRAVTLETLGIAHAPAVDHPLTLAQAVPKGKTMDLIVQKATELGVSTLVPLVSERTVVTYTPEEAARKQAKWRRVAIEACKQSGQNWLPRVELPRSAAAFLAEPPRADLALIASLDAEARPLKPILAEFHEMHGRTPTDALVLIGPEGDFTPAEIGLARSSGLQPLGLGPIVLRTETAALYALSILGHELRS